jgi:hypothetical protein
MKVAALILAGSILWTVGLRYFSQFTKMFVNLSIPATKGPTPKATRKAQKAALSSFETNILIPL